MVGIKVCGVLGCCKCRDDKVNWIFELPLLPCAIGSFDFVKLGIWTVICRNGDGVLGRLFTTGL